MSAPLVPAATIASGAARTFALVTGASSGIGEQLARKLAARGASLVLVARSVEKLRALGAELAARHAVEVVPVAMDLAESGAAARLVELTEGAGRPVDVLALNAGFGLNGALHELDPERVAGMLRLNVGATTELAARFVPAMRARGRGSVLVVASTAAFLPGPYFGAYSASKAYLVSFAAALREELRADGIGVTCLCPGNTATHFAETAGMSQRLPLFPTLRAEDVAEAGLLGLERDRALVIVHPYDRLWIFLTRFLPRGLPVKLAAALFSRSRKLRAPEA